MNRRSLADTPRLLLVLLALVWPTLALADARIEARRHFRKGMALIAEGSVDAGVAELKEAYATKPHPNVLYNIARAYHDAGRVPEALEYYHQYLAANPPDEGQVRATVQRLEESLAAAETKKPKEKEPRVEPPPKQEVLIGPPAPGMDAESLARLKALMDRLETAVARAELANKIAAAEAPAEKPAAAAGPEAQATTDESAETAGAVPYEEQVVTASRRAQSTLEAPNATTIITGEEIRMSGATTLVDILRRVPGADVMVLGVGSANVSLRGFNQRLANKVLVLIDGRTEYQDFLGLTVWSALPVGLEEIDRIEVIRGPGSALYGANAMLGIINIITRQPGTGRPADFTARGGMGNSLYGSFVASGGKGVRYRASVGYTQADKWTRDFPDTQHSGDATRTDVQANATNTDLGLRSARANLQMTYNFTPDVQAGLSGGLNRVYTEFYPLGLLRNFYFDGFTSYVKADLSAGPVKFKAFWNHLESDAGSEYGAVGERPITMHVVSNVVDGELLFSKEFQLAGQHRLGLGLEARLKQVDWEVLSPPEQTEVHVAGFVQDEWRIIEPLRVVASYRIDRHPLLANGEPGYAPSPRVAAVWIPVEGQALRVGYSQAFREPTFLESYTQFRITVPSVPGASVLTEGNKQLDAETLNAFELGYRGDLPILGLEYDLALYQNHVRRLIGLSGLMPDVNQFYDAATNTYLVGHSQFVNEPNIYVANGVELGAKLSPLDGLDLRASGAYENISGYQLTHPEDPNNQETRPLSTAECGACTQTPALKLFGGISYRSPINLDFSLEASWVSRTTWVEREISGNDIAEAHYPQPAYAVVNARVAYRFLQDHASVAIQGTNIGVSQTQHPFGNQISQRYYLTLTVIP